LAITEEGWAHSWTVKNHVDRYYHGSSYSYELIHAGCGINIMVRKGALGYKLSSLRCKGTWIDVNKKEKRHLNKVLRKLVKKHKQKEALDNQNTQNSDLHQVSICLTNKEGHQ